MKKGSNQLSSTLESEIESSSSNWITLHFEVMGRFYFQQKKAINNNWNMVVFHFIIIFSPDAVVYHRRFVPYAQRYRAKEHFKCIAPFHASNIYCSYLCHECVMHYEWRNQLPLNCICSWDDDAIFYCYS